MMKMIVGLGNPGAQYINTRHNVGFMFLDRYAKKLHCEDQFREKFHGIYAKINLSGEDILLVKPLTYMNLSGICVKEIASFYKIPIQNILVIYDDKDLPFAHLRLREKGNPGSHNGMKSIVSSLNDIHFPRVRIGIGQPENDQDMASFVLSRFNQDELCTLEKSLDDAMKVADLFVTDQFVMAMNRYNAGKKHE